MRTLVSCLIALCLPSLAGAATILVDSDKELQWLERQRSIDGSVIVRMPGLTSLSLPRLAQVTERLEIASPGLVSVQLPALERVGADLNVGCVLHPREEWETRGPISPVPPEAAPEPSFADGPPPSASSRGSKRRAPDSEGPSRLVLPRLRAVGGSLSVCSPGLLGVQAGRLDQVGRDLQLFAGAAWTTVELAALERVRSTLFLWLDGADLRLTAPKLDTVGAAVQAGGTGTLALSLSGLEMAAGVTVSGSRRTAGGGEADVPSLTLTALELPKLARASQRVEVRSVGGLTSLVLPTLTEAGSLRIEDLPQLTRFSAPALVQVERSAVLLALPSLAELGVAALVRVGERYQLGGLGLDPLVLGVEEIGSLVVSGQASRVVRADALVEAGAILLEGLGLVELVSFGALERIGAQLVVRDCVGGPGSPLPAPSPDDTTARVFEAPRLTQVGQDRRDGLRMGMTAFSVLQLPSLAEVHGDLSLTDMPWLQQVAVGRLGLVEGKILIGGSARLEVLEMPSLEDAEALELIALTGLRRVSARRLDTQVRQTRGTRVASLDVGAAE